ncbi:MAG: hypothetical protein WC386_02605 [Candidatus Paceibacterota bacterium]|jgi:hypothetical protein
MTEKNDTEPFFIAYKTPFGKTGSIKVTFEFCLGEELPNEMKGTDEQVIDFLSTVFGHLPPLIASHLAAFLLICPIDPDAATDLLETIEPFFLPPEGLEALSTPLIPKEIGDDFLVAYS